MGVPLTLMVSPGAKLVDSEFVLGAPDNSVALLICPGTAALLVATLPATCSGGRVAVEGVLRPSAVNAAEFVVVTVRLDPALLRSVITPPLTVDGIVVPVIESIFASIVWTLSVRLSWLPVAPEATKVMGVPLTVMVSVEPEAGGQRIRARGTGQQRRAGDRRGGRRLVVDRGPCDPQRRLGRDGAEAERRERGGVRTRYGRGPCRCRCAG